MTRSEWRRRKGRSGHFVPRSVRFAIYARDNFDCVYCRRVFPLDLSGRGLHLDHVIPRSRGGTHEPANLVTACVRCNTSKRASHYPDTTANVQRRVRRALVRPVNLGLGKWLARVARSL